MGKYDSLASEWNRWLQEASIEDYASVSWGMFVSCWFDAIELIERSRKP